MTPTATEHARRVAVERRIAGRVDPRTAMIARGATLAAMVADRKART